MIAAAEGDQSDSVSLDPWMQASCEIEDIPVTSFDPKENAYKMREQVQDLINTYLKKGAEAVNQKIYQQKVDQLYGTVTIEVDMGGGLAGGELQANYGKFLDANTGTGSGRTGFESFSGEKGATSSNETAHGFAPEPETVRMTPEEQGIVPQEEHPAVIDESIVADDSIKFDYTSDNTKVGEYAKANPKLPQPDLQARQLEVRFRVYEKADGAARAHLDSQFRQDLKDLQAKDASWWNQIEDADTKSYLEHLLNRS
jgi:hypothetical protein